MRFRTRHRASLHRFLLRASRGRRALDGDPLMKPLWMTLAAVLWTASSAFAADAPAPATAPTAQTAAQKPAEAPPSAEGYIRWLEERSMLHQAQQLAQRYSGNAAQWQHPYGTPQPRAATARASVWFTAYPASTIGKSSGASVLDTLADERLWQAFQAIGIQGIHTGPMKRSGGVTDLAYTPSVDGNFDRISFDTEPAFGTEAQYRAPVE